MNKTLQKLKPNPSNPRTISKKEFQRLVEKLRSFPEMLEKRPILYDENFIVLGGNMRLRALKQLEKEDFKVKDTYFNQIEGWSEAQKKQFVINDNIAEGQWDYDVLANEWSDLPLDEWGVEGLEKLNKEEEIEPEVDFAEELYEEHNYVVLYFDNEIDWLNLQTLYTLPKVKGLDAKDGYERKGIGRVVKGAEFIEKIRK